MSEPNKRGKIQRDGTWTSKGGQGGELGKMIVGELFENAGLSFRLRRKKEIAVLLPFREPNPKKETRSR